jgi:hypothetical protein
LPLAASASKTPLSGSTVLHPEKEPRTTASTDSIDKDFLTNINITNSPEMIFCLAGIADRRCVAKLDYASF